MTAWKPIVLSVLALAALVHGPSAAATATDGSVQVGPRPYYLIDKMTPSPLQRRLAQCAEGPFRVTDFSIGHRGAALQFPEHTKESYEAAARMGAGIIECDVTFTADAKLVCRHSQCDLHTTTNILLTDLAGKCSQPFAPAEYDAAGNLVKAASANCCTSDISLAEYKSLCAKMDAADPRATTAEAYVLGGTPNWRTDLYATYPAGNPRLNPDAVCTGTLLTHQESIALIGGLGRKFTPELKGPSVAMPYSNPDFGVFDFSQEDYARLMLKEYKDAGVPPAKVWAQSFNLDDVLFWIKDSPNFGRQAVYLEDAATPADLPDRAQMKGWADQGVKILGSPLYSLVALDAGGRVVPSAYARQARGLGFDIIGWSFERSAPVQQMKGGVASPFYYQTTIAGLQQDGDIYQVLDVIARRVGAIGVFSDWPGSVSYYASCVGLK
jgi:glycerophosphoryl diester phosphodiesterase